MSLRRPGKLLLLEIPPRVVSRDRSRNPKSKEYVEELWHFTIMVEGSGRLPDTAVETPIGPQAPLLQKNGRELSSPKGAPVVIDGNASKATYVIKY